MDNESFWKSINRIINKGFNPEDNEKLEYNENYFATGGSYLNDFHRKNSMAAQREVRLMSLHPSSREQKLRQIIALKNSHNNSQISNFS